jgi:soluble lytic murein transglycosylase-like protein
MGKYFKLLLILLSMAIFFGLFLANTEARKPAGTAGPSLEWPERSPELLSALIRIESSGNPKAWQKETGARGLTQIRPIAWKELAANFPQKYRRKNYRRDIFRPEVAYEAGRDYLDILARYLKKQSFALTVDNLLCAYNWGIGNFLRYGLNNAPEQTRRYIRQVKELIPNIDGG